MFFIESGLFSVRSSECRGIVALWRQKSLVQDGHGVEVTVSAESAVSAFGQTVLPSSANKLGSTPAAIACLT